MFKIQQKCDLKNLLIQRKVQVLEQNIEKKVKVLKIWHHVIFTNSHSQHLIYLSWNLKGCSTWRGSSNDKARSKCDSKCERKCQPCSGLQKQRNNTTSL